MGVTLIIVKEHYSHNVYITIAPFTRTNPGYFYNPD